MNKDKALKMAGYDLDGVIADVEKFNGFDDVCLQTIKRVRSVIEEALEQPAQEPVAYNFEGVLFFANEASSYMKDSGQPLYTNYHQWQGLTDEEIKDFWTKHQPVLTRCPMQFAHAIEQALKDRNHG